MKTLVEELKTTRLSRHQRMARSTIGTRTFLALPTDAATLGVVLDPNESGCGFIHIEQLEVYARIGVTKEERQQPQRMTATMTLWPNKSMHEMNDEISPAVDYAAVCATTRDFMDQHSYKLLETYAAQLASHLLQGFPLRRVVIELRKFVIADARHVAVVLTQTAVDA